MTQITLTPAAKNFLQGNLAQSPAGTVGIKFGLRDAGCSGYAYTIDFAQEIAADDQVFNFDAVKIIVPAQHLNALHGTEIDYVQQGINSVLQFNNPNVVNQCGCGESFQFKDK
jgi:iron-sulfur cluster assembly protein